MGMLNSEAKLFGLDLRDLAGQLRSAWDGLGQLPWVSRFMPASRVKVIEGNGLQPKWAWVIGGQRWTWDNHPEPDPAQSDAKEKPLYTALLLDGDQQLLRTLHLPSMPPAAIHSAMALDVQTMSPFPEEETLWAYRVHAPGERERAAIPGLSLDLCITSRTLVRQALQQSSQTAEDVEVWGGSRRMPILFRGFGEGRRLKHEARKRYWIWLTGAALLALVLALALTPTAQLRLRAIDARVQFQQLLEETQPVAAQRQVMTAGAQEMAQLRDQLHGQVNHLRVLAALAQAYPDDTAVQRIQFKGRQITVQGLSDNASNVVQIMNRTPGFTAVRMPSAVTKVPGSSKENYVVEAQIDTSVLGLYPPPPASAPTAPEPEKQEPSR